MAHCDVLVVGAGLAGLETARRLAEGGAMVMLVDRKSAVDEAVHTTGIFVRRTLESFSFPADCLGPGVRRIVLHAPSGKAQVLESTRDEFRVGRMEELYRRKLDACIQAGVEWRPSTSLDRVALRAGRSHATVRHAGAADTIESRFIIGADGARSRVATELGLDENREWIVGVEEVYARVTTGLPPALHCWLDPTIAPGYIAWVVDDGTEVHVGVGGYADRFQPSAALRTFTERVASAFGMHGLAPTERRGGLIPVGGVLPRIVSVHGLLTGDAAGAVSPLTAGGLDPCLRLSDLAVRVTLRFLESGDPSSLEPYHGTEFRARFRSRLLLRRMLASVRSPAAAELACAALRLPLMRKVAEQVYFGSGSFPDVPADAGPADEVTRRRGGTARRGGVQSPTPR